MKKIIQGISLFGFMVFFLLLNQGCRKQDLFSDFSDKAPEIAMDSIYTTGDGKIGLFAHVVKEGGSPIEIAGFYYGKDGYVNELSNQILVEPTNGKLEAWIEDVEPDSTYTFGCFAANEFTSCKSTIQATIPRPVPVTPPCNIPEGNIVFDGSINTTSYESARFSGSDYVIEADTRTISGNANLSFHFIKKPLSGVYTEDSYAFNNNSPKGMYMSIHFGFDRYGIKDGAKVYIEELEKNSNKYRVTFCSAFFTAFSTPFELKGHFVTN